jgi:hypothetical protein
MTAPKARARDWTVKGEWGGGRGVSEERASERRGKLGGVKRAGEVGGAAGGAKANCWRYAVGRRIPAVVAVLAASGIALRIALAAGHWDSYGALQLPLVFEAVAAAAIAVSTASPFGEPERVAGRWLPVLRLSSALMLTALAAGLLAAAGTGAHLAGGPLDVLRNVAGLTGLGLLSAAVLGGGLAWTGPVGYLMAGAYALYTQWHPPALRTPWLWPARPPHDAGGALCAGLVFLAGLAVTTMRGARDPAGE